MARKTKKEMQDEAQAEMLPDPVNEPDPTTPEDFLAQMKRANRWVKEKQARLQEIRDRMSEVKAEIDEIQDKADLAGLKKKEKKIQQQIRQVWADGLNRAEQLTLFAVSA